MRRRHGRGDERGAATVLVVGCVAVLAVLASGWVAVGRAALARQRAETAADLAALAGAGAVQRGDDGCTAAGRAAGRNAATLVSCVRDADDLLVTVRVTAPTAASAQARAGPESVAGARPP